MEATKCPATDAQVRQTLYTHTVQCYSLEKYGDFDTCQPGESYGQRNLVGCSPWGRKSRTRLSDSDHYYYSTDEPWEHMLHEVSQAQTDKF